MRRQYGDTVVFQQTGSVLVKLEYWLQFVFKHKTKIDIKLKLYF